VETYLFFIIILFVLAVSGLIVGVANDAVNFLNSAIGSKAAPRVIIIVIAGLGVFAGTIFSAGMMEVARKGIFNPELFKLNEVMVIFLAVMFTDVLLLDFYNTFGLPTSTTVSLVAALVSGSVVMSLIKISQAGQSINEIANYINSGKVLGIFSAILISIVISFIAGAIVQYFSRMIFTFDYESKLKRYGAVWSAFALTAITYFIFLKGIDGTVFLQHDTVAWIKNNSLLVLGYSFIGWTILLQLILWFTNYNILKPIVLIGTFSLALAFSANDLVNFIGVPLAGLASYQIGLKSANPFGINMEALREPVKTESWILLIAGVIMIVTLLVNKKSRTVSKTEINLGRQHEGFEKFDSSIFARNVVRMSISFGKTMRKILPASLFEKIDKRFDSSKIDYSKFSKKDRPAFDYIRATSNLMVASSLISLGTAYQLPLSTTYVTFIVAMATSFADRAWGRESAVYRVSGVVTVVSGWFLTAFIGFLCAAVFTIVMYYGGMPVILIIIGFSVFLVFKSNILHKKKEKKEAKKEAAIVIEARETLVNALDDDIKSFFNTLNKCFKNIYSGLTDEDRKKLKKALNETKDIEENSAAIIGKMMQGAQYLDEIELQEELGFGKAISSIQDTATSIREIAKITFEHVDNNHSGLTKDQKEDFKQLKELLSEQFELASSKITKKDIAKLEDLHDKMKEIKKSIKKLDKNQITHIKKGTSKPRTNLLFLNILFKVENISDNVSEIIRFNRQLLKGKK